MSGIYAALVRSDDGGVRHDTNTVIKRSQHRGDQPARTALIQGDWRVEGQGTVDLNTALLNQLAGKNLLDKYTVLGACVSGTKKQLQPRRSVTGRYIYVWDGEITGVDEENPLKSFGGILDDRGFWFVSDFLGGNFAAIVYDLEQPNKLFWMTRAKPLYALYDNLGRATRIASAKEFFNGMYHPFRNPSPLELGPYDNGSIDDVGRIEVYPVKRPKGNGTLVLSGGGLDTLVAASTRLPKPIKLLYVDYGARAAQREWEATQDIAAAVGADWMGVNALPLQQSMRSALTGGREVLKNSVAGVASEWVPGRNSLLMAIALSMAESADIAHVVTGINMAAASAYPDNEEEWAKKWQAVVPYSVNTTSVQPEILSPLAGLSKTGVVKLAKALGIPPLNLAMSWSCYEGGTLQCGMCSSCRTRREAFISANMEDQTRYAS